MRFESAGLQYEAYDTFEKTSSVLQGFRIAHCGYETLLTNNRIWIGRTKAWES